MKKSPLKSPELERVGATVLEQAAEAIAIIDRELRIQWVNKAFELITGYDEGDVVGQPLRILRADMHPEAFYD
ncbi:MAG: PAS domain-containing protein, partial [Halofilum sp. (in: g-proteobacteria)]|nr:PAS domain-containing protein [Halofilum sp. (in: g-proteobacteria)]